MFFFSSSSQVILRLFSLRFSRSSSSSSSPSLLSYASSSSSSSSHFRRFFFSSSETTMAEKEGVSNSKPNVPKDSAYLDSVIQKRITLFKAQQIEERSRLAGEPIRITLPDGTVKDGKKWTTSPFDIAKEISKSLASNALISQVNGVLWDMHRPLEGDCELKLFTFDTDEGRDTMWHSSAHILGQSLEMEYGCKLCIGPCTTRGEASYERAFYPRLRRGYSALPSALVRIRRTRLRRGRRWIKMVCALRRTRLRRGRRWMKVLQAISKALDDPKRTVRQEAARCRQTWVSIASRSGHF